MIDASDYYSVCNLHEGLPNTSGLLVRRHVKSSKDADAVACMRKAGAIPLAVTNMSELCMWYESSNLIYGRTNNAYHQGRTAGGSSGDSSANTLLCPQPSILQSIMK